MRERERVLRICPFFSIEKRETSEKRIELIYLFFSPGKQNSLLRPSNGASECSKKGKEKKKNSCV